MIKLLLASLVAVGLIGGPQVVTFGKERHYNGPIEDTNNPKIFKEEKKCASDKNCKVKEAERKTLGKEGRAPIY